MDINDKLDIISFKNQQISSMDSTQTKDKTTNDLYNKMIAAKENVTLAPIEAEKAKQLYYQFTGKTDSDADSEANAFGNEIANNYQSLVDSIQQKIQYYDSQYKYLNQLDSMLFEYYEQILKNLHTITTELNQTTTNDRKVYYLNEELSTIDSWNHLFFIIHLFILYKMFYKLYDNYRNEMNDYMTLFIIVLFIIFMTPFFYNICVWLFGIISYIVYLKPFTYTHL
jgi:hypothetical protein